MKDGVDGELTECSSSKENLAILKDAKLLRDLENDSVDSEILQDELNDLDHRPISKREKIVKFLQSNPVQILLCVIVLLDAGIVIGQILLDLNSVKEKLHKRERQLGGLVEFIKQHHADQLLDYHGKNANRILQILKQNLEKSKIHHNGTSYSSPSLLTTPNNKQLKKQNLRKSQGKNDLMNSRRKRELYHAKIIQSKVVQDQKQDKLIKKNKIKEGEMGKKVKNYMRKNFWIMAKSFFTEAAKYANKINISLFNKTATTPIFQKILSLPEKSNVKQSFFFTWKHVNKQKKTYKNPLHFKKNLQNKSLKKQLKSLYIQTAPPDLPSSPSSHPFCFHFSIIFPDFVLHQLQKTTQPLVLRRITIDCKPKTASKLHETHVYSSIAVLLKSLKPSPPSPSVALSLFIPNNKGKRIEKIIENYLSRYQSIPKHVLMKIYKILLRSYHMPYDFFEFNEKNCVSAKVTIKTFYKNIKNGIIDHGNNKTLSKEKRINFQNNIPATNKATFCNQNKSASKVEEYTKSKQKSKNKSLSKRSIKAEEIKSDGHYVRMQIIKMIKNQGEKNKIKRADHKRDEPEANISVEQATDLHGAEKHRNNTIKTTKNDHGEEEDDEEEEDVLRRVAHGLHYASIGLLGFLVFEDLVKIFAMGWSFCKHRIEIFDAIIIASSFAIDLIFLGGVAGEEGQKAAAVLVILLLWRIARVVDGIVVTVKQRQEFRIRLQKRARRVAEKKLEQMELEKIERTRQVEALKDLCTKAGVPNTEIMTCVPKNPCHTSTTLDALSSVAKLSVSMTMLMSSSHAVTNLANNSKNKLPEKETENRNESTIDETSFNFPEDSLHQVPITNTQTNNLYLSYQTNSNEDRQSTQMQDFINTMQKNPFLCYNIHCSHPEHYGWPSNQNISLKKKKNRYLVNEKLLKLDEKFKTKNKNKSKSFNLFANLINRKSSSSKKEEEKTRKRLINDKCEYGLQHPQNNKKPTKQTRYLISDANKRKDKISRDTTTSTIFSGVGSPDDENTIVDISCRKKNKLPAKIKKQKHIEKDLESFEEVFERENKNEEENDKEISHTSKSKKAKRLNIDQQMNQPRLKLQAPNLKNLTQKNEEILSKSFQQNEALSLHENTPSEEQANMKNSSETPGSLRILPTPQLIFPQSKSLEDSCEQEQVKAINNHQKTSHPPQPLPSTRELILQPLNLQLQQKEKIKNDFIEKHKKHNELLLKIQKKKKENEKRDTHKNSIEYRFSKDCCQQQLAGVRGFSSLSDEEKHRNEKKTKKCSSVEKKNVGFFESKIEIEKDAIKKHKDQCISAEACEEISVKINVKNNNEEENEKVFFDNDSTDDDKDVNAK